MVHNVGNLIQIVNIMGQDESLGISGSVTQADLAPLRAAGRLGDYALVYRVERTHLGGGYGDQNRHPLAWAVAVYVDAQLCRVFNARGAGREWNSADRLSVWLRDQGFWYWWMRNDLEPVGSATRDVDELLETAPPPLPTPPIPTA